MKKNKSKQLDLLYIKEEDKKTKKEAKKVAGKKGPAKPKKQKQDKKKEESELFNFDDEIVIGVTKIEDKQDKKKKANKKKNTKKQAKAKSTVNKEVKKQKSENKKNAKQVEKEKKKRKKIAFVLKCCSLLALIVGTGLFMFLSPTFNVKKINVTGNEQLTEQEIISLSGITLEENTFKIRLSKAEDDIKSQAYVESVKVSRKLPSEITIEVTERKPSFMLEVGNAYVYMNTQGYFLEISENKLELPVILGYQTELD